MKLLAAMASVVLAALAIENTQEPALEPDAGPAQRIWCADMQEQQEVWLRRRFALPARTTTARLLFTCDNECTVFVNGVRVGSSNSWEELTVVDLDQLGRDNLLAVHARNTGGPAALACWLLWKDVAGTDQALVTDPEWRVSTTEEKEWATLAFDDKDWPAATANFTATFGRNIYNGKPTRILWRNRFAEAADPIEAALERLRRARDREAALKALDAVERAVTEARAKVWGAKAVGPGKGR